MADLYIDSQGLADFASQLRNLASDFTTPIVGPSMELCDGSLLDDLRELSTDDAACGASLDNYLTSLAGYAENVMQQAAKLDSDLAQSAFSRRPPFLGNL